MGDLPGIPVHCGIVAAPSRATPSLGKMRRSPRTGEDTCALQRSLAMNAILIALGALGLTGATGFAAFCFFC